MKKTLIWIVLLLMFLFPLAAHGEEIRGWVKGEGYQYVLLGEYPYEKDGTVKPVLWRVLEVQDGVALLLTENVIDASQVIFETDKKVMEDHSYRRISSFEESDLYVHLNTTVLDTLLGDDPIRGALREEPGGGLLFIMNNMQFLNPDYGFSATQWNDQPSRWAAVTPYASSRGVYSTSSGKQSSYWVATLKSPEGYMMQIVGYNGHLSWGGYTRTNVGLRLSVRLDLNELAVTGGTGAKDDPFTFDYAGEAPALKPVEEPVEEAAEGSAEVAVDEEPEAAEAPAEKADGTITVSFVGDCSIGDSIQYRDYGSSYHTAIANNGYDWPFSLVKEYLQADDLTVANCEVVFTTQTRHTDKMYNLVAKPEHVQAFAEGSIEVVNTVNNHAMDFYQAGYQDTLDTLEAAGIGHFGTINADREGGFDDLYVAQVGELRIGFVGFTYPQIENREQTMIIPRIQKLKEEDQCDLVVVSLHWGKEVSMTPVNSQLDVAKRLIDGGADVIWGHHPHVIQPIQFYNGKPIMHSTGNFTFGTMSQVDRSTGIFQLTYEKVDGQAVLKRLQVIPCYTQYQPDFRPYELTDPAERQGVFRKLSWQKETPGFENPPESFLETGVIEFEDGQMLP